MGEAVSPHEVAEGISMWSPTMFAVLSGAIIVMAVFAMQYYAPRRPVVSV